VGLGLGLGLGLGVGVGVGLGLGLGLGLGCHLGAARPHHPWRLLLRLLLRLRR
jgi:hypothetical protein